MTQLSSHGHPIDETLFAPLVDSTDHLGNRQALLADLEANGYLLLRGVLDRDLVLKAREEVFTRLAEVGEIRSDRPITEGVATGTSRRGETAPDLGAFWRSVSESPSLVKIVREGNAIRFYETLLGEAVRPYDFIWLRTMTVGRASGFHYDHVYMNRGTPHVLSSWIPLGDIRRHEGTLLVVEGSHRFQDLIDRYTGLDVDRGTLSGTITTDPVGFARERGTRLLSADFRAGDMMVLSMFCLHGSLDNNSAEGKIRLSCDARYQRASEPIDERWVGENPLGHGKGYGSLSAAQPLTAPPIFR